jgi:hypothetical protein
LRKRQQLLLTVVVKLDCLAVLEVLEVLEVKIKTLQKVEVYTSFIKYWG